MKPFHLEKWSYVSQAGLLPEPPSVGINRYEPSHGLLVINHLGDPYLARSSQSRLFIMFGLFQTFVSDHRVSVKSSYQ